MLADALLMVYSIPHKRFQQANHPCLWTGKDAMPTQGSQPSAQTAYGAAAISSTTVDGIQTGVGHPIMHSMQLFQRWLLELRQAGMASTTMDRVVDIELAATRSFCIGVAENRIFFGLQAAELAWFLGLPWLHVAVRRGGQNITFVCEESTVGDVALPCFALALKTESREKVALLTRQHYLDVRRIEVGVNDEVTSVSRRVLGTVDIQIVENERSLEGLLAGKYMTGYTNRSVFRSAKK